MLVSELYEECLQYGVSTLAHCLYYLLMEKKISLHDDISNIHINQIDRQKIEELVRKNVLGLYKIGIYSLKVNKKDFVFIFAATKEEAIEFFINTFQQAPLNCHEYPLDFQIERGNEVITFREMRKEFERFPAIAGYFCREW